MNKLSIHLLMNLAAIGLLTQADQCLLGDMLVLHDQDQPVYGLLVYDDATSNQEEILFLVFDPPSKRFERRLFTNDKVRIAIKTIDQVRIANLNLNNLGSIRNCAEELASHKKDPVAQLLARRLALLCMYHGSKTKVSNADAAVVTSAAKTLVQLATSPTEKEQFELLVFIYGSDGPRNPIAFGSTGTNGSNSRELFKHDSVLLPVIQALRQADFSEAGRLLNLTPAKQAQASWEQLGLWSGMQEAVRERRLTPNLKRNLIASELRIRFGIDRTRDGKNQTTASGVTSNQLRSLDLVEIADFDLKSSSASDNRSWLQFDGATLPITAPSARKNE